MPHASGQAAVRAPLWEGGEREVRCRSYAFRVRLVGLGESLRRSLHVGAAEFSAVYRFRRLLLRSRRTRKQALDAACRLSRLARAASNCATRSAMVATRCARTHCARTRCARTCRRRR
eukprot:5776928-Pleurochrysis_carterae.AAC.1